MQLLFVLLLYFFVLYNLLIINKLSLLSRLEIIGPEKARI